MIIHRVDSIKELKNDKSLKEQQQAVTNDAILELYEEQQMYSDAILEIYEMFENFKEV